MCAGAISITGNLKLIGLFLGGFTGLIIALYPALLFWIAILVSLIVAGLAQLYLPQLQLIRWAIIPVTFALLLHAFLQLFQPVTQQENISRTMPVIVGISIAFILINVFSAVLNLQTLPSFITGFKGYFQVWGLLFAMAYIGWDKRLMEITLPRVIFIIALIQIPFALHQYLFVVPSRVGIVRGLVPIDIVSGTFGGSVLGGGANAVLAAYMFVVWSCVLALWKNKVISLTRMLVISAILLSPVLINEAKVSVVYVVAVFLTVFRRGSFKNMLRFIGIGFVSFAIVAIMLAAFVRHAPEGKVESWSDLIAYTYEYNVEKDDAFGDKLSRGGAIKLWMQEHGSLTHTLFGYGVGATRSEERNQLAQQLGINNPASYGVGAIAIVAVLWESGITGLLVMIMLFFVAFRTAGKLESEYEMNPWLSALFVGLQGAIVVLFISLWHKNFFVFHIGFQAIPILIFGYLAYWSRQKKINGRQ